MNVASKMVEKFRPETPGWAFIDGHPSVIPAWILALEPPVYSTEAVTSESLDPARSYSQSDWWVALAEVPRSMFDLQRPVGEPPRLLPVTLRWMEPLLGAFSLTVMGLLRFAQNSKVVPPPGWGSGEWLTFHVQDAVAVMTSHAVAGRK